MGLFEKLKRKKGGAETGDGNGDDKGFIGFVLLSDYQCDWELLQSTLKKEWKINVDLSGDEDKPDAKVVGYKGATICFALMDAPVPNGEAEKNAVFNYMWKEAEEKTKTHKAHLIVSVLGQGISPKKKGELFVKVAAACCGLENVIGLYTNGVVYEPAFYIDAAQMAKKGDLPLINLVWFGLRQTEQRVTAYTIGLNNFGKDEMEVLDVAQPADKVGNFLLDMVAYVLDGDVTLRDGDTIGFSAEQKLAITKSPGVCVDGMTLKIEYGEA